MTNGIRNALLFGGSALVAALAVSYGLGAFTPVAQNTVAESAAPTENSMTAKEGRVPGTAEKTAPQAAGSDQASTQPQAGVQTGKADATGTDTAPDAKGADAANKADVTAPSFDVVRAEGNGSIVVAGRSAPGAKVEILSGASVLGAAKAGAEGDFAIVHDDPLKPGDYQLVLRSTSPANVVAMSKQTAVVSIPEHENGQVLALVEAPGQPSKLITVPQPDKAAGTAPAPAAPGAGQGGAQQNAAAGAANPASSTQTASNGGATDGTKQPGATGVPSGNTAAATGSGNGQQIASADAGTSRPAGANGASQAAASAEPGSAQPATAAQSQVSVEAVEIEGNKIFVAGIADPGSTVRVYANDTVLGEAKTSPVGRFLVESIHELAVGDYIIRADMLAADGLKVAARAAVPFTRAPGESVAAVASGEVGSGNAANGAGKPENSMTAAAGQPSAGSTTAPNAAGENGAAQVVASNGQNSAVLPPLDNDIAKQPPTIVSPKLEGTSGAVIIRRGDTLWQISRRVYGHGVRYSTIYLANQDQIEDPDLIWPGQIFAVPHETEKGETANMKAIAGQMTQMPKKTVE
jgi:nucleoid-associated protein YgaU